MNRIGFANTTLIVLAVAVVGAAGYFILNNWPLISEPKPVLSLTNEISSNWQFIDAGSFTLYLPPDWKFNKLQGIDSYVGEFAGDGVNLRFDFGRYSNSLAEDDDPNYIVTYEIIDGHKAKIVVPKVAGSGITGVYFDKLGGSEGMPQIKLNLYGKNFTLFQQEIILGIFRTLKIVK